MNKKRIRNIAITASVIWAVLFIYILTQFISQNFQPRQLSTFLLDIPLMFVVGYYWSGFFDAKRQAREHNEKSDQPWVLLILLTLICLTPMAYTYIDLNSAQMDLLLPLTLYFIFLIIVTQFWMMIWIQTDLFRKFDSLFTLRMVNKMSGKPGFAIIKKTKGKVLVGDIFVFRFKEDSDYYYGRVLATNIMAEERSPMVDGSHIAFIYSSKTKDMTTENLKMDYRDYFMGPFMVSDLHWRKGYFFTIGNLPLTEEEIGLDYGFMDLDDDVEPAKEEYYDKKLHRVSNKPQFVGPAYHIPTQWLCDLLKRVLSNKGEKPLIEYLEDDLMSTKYQA